MNCCSTNPENQFDLMIIGGGSAAFAAAIKANDRQIKTLLVNGGLPLGGTCVNVGCIPSKFLVRAAEAVHRAAHSPFSGIQLGQPTIDFKKIIEQKRQLVNNLQQRKYADLLPGLPFVTVKEGLARFAGDRTIEVEGEQYEGLKVIIATGASTFIPPVEGLKDIPYLTSTSLFELEEMPSSLVILGAGYTALEIAQAYNRLGTKVTLLQRSAAVLSSQQKDVSDEITRHLASEGITILTGTSIKRVWKEADTIHVSFSRDGANDIVAASHLLVATGTRANTAVLDTEKTGVKRTDKGSVIVDSYLRTNHPDIYAVGDVTTLPAYVYTAAQEGSVAVHNAFDPVKQRVDFSVLPWVVFTDPQVAGVGLDEKQAEEKGIPYQTTILPLSEVPRSIAAFDTRGFIKLTRNPETDLLIGARIVAPEGSELAMEISLAIKYKIPVKELMNLLHPYLTLAEAIKLAAMSFTTDVKKMSCCAS